MFRAALGNDVAAIQRLQDAYLGHLILRPIPGAPFGRTVVRTYPDSKGIAAGTPRIMFPQRTYEAHIAGLTLRVDGLAWQQQDSAVGSCATVALWSMLHSSAFDDHHAIPTTAEITASAHLVPGNGRTFPADDGLRIEQMLEVIKRHDLAPVLIPGDVGPDRKFSRKLFSTLVASFVRSGYPVLVRGDLDDGIDRGAHAVCIVGVRSPAPAPVEDGTAALDDENVNVVYLHDDNLGPNVRFEIVDVPDLAGDTIDLRPAPPEPPRGPWPTVNPTSAYGTITPTELVVAVHHELRTAPLALQQAAIKWSAWLPAIMDYANAQQSKPTTGVTGLLVGSRFLRLRDYMDHELKSALRARPPNVLAQARLALWETVPPMSLHIGLVRVSLGTTPMIDLLFDTSDSDRHIRPTAYVAYHPEVPELLHLYQTEFEALDLGHMVRAW
ncbi:MAG: hypothetical protein ABI867_40010 [Kofleriaceae bacterium]